MWVLFHTLLLKFSSTTLDHVFSHWYSRHCMYMCSHYLACTHAHNYYLQILTYLLCLPAIMWLSFCQMYAEPLIGGETVHLWRKDTGSEKATFWWNFTLLIMLMYKINVDLYRSLSCMVEPHDTTISALLLLCHVLGRSLGMSNVDSPWVIRFIVSLYL